MTDRFIEFHEMDPYPLTPEQQASMDFILAHWRTNADDTGLEWSSCGPKCTHSPDSES